KVISRSTFDLQAVLNTLIESAVRLCEADMGGIARPKGEVLQFAASYGYSSDYQAYMDDHPLLSRRGSAVGRATLGGRTIHIPDVLADPDYEMTELAKIASLRTVLAVPLLREGLPIGVIGLQRQTVRPFTDKQIELATTFADQAVIAIENVRLFDEVQARTRELSKSLEQQTATSEVLQVISSSPGDLEPVFQAMLENATRICDAKFGTLMLREGDAFRIMAIHGTLPPEYVEERRRRPVLPATPGTGLAHLIAAKRPIQIADIREEPAYHNEPARALIDIAGARTLVAVPMLKEDELVGSISIYRQEVCPLSDKQIELLTNFAAQAVIAIENARLRKEVRESLQQQTATAEVLKVISSSPGALTPVFDAMLQNAVSICEAKFGVMFRFDGDVAYAVAMLNLPPALDEYLQQRGRRQPAPGSDLEKVFKLKQVIHTIDSSEPPNPIPPARLAGARTCITVPMLKETELVGAIVIYRQDVRPFTDKQIELVTNFAAQAVIAIENARLLNELRQRTDDLTEALEQQTATAGILSVISNSLNDTQPVFNAIVESGLKLFPGATVVILLADGNKVDAAAIAAPDRAGIEALRRR